MAKATQEQLFEVGRITVSDRVDLSQLNRERVQAHISDPDGLAQRLIILLNEELPGKGKSGILRLISGADVLTLDPTDGLETLGQATDVFTGYIDSDFQKYGCNVTSSAIPATKAAVHEMVRNGTLTQIFGSFGVDLDKLCLTQPQIKQFCRKHRDQLRTEGYATFLLFKANGEFFVASVYWSDARKLEAHVNRLADAYVWSGGHRHRVVVPQLAPAAPDA